MINCSFSLKKFDLTDESIPLFYPDSAPHLLLMLPFISNSSVFLRCTCLSQVTIDYLLLRTLGTDVKQQRVLWKSR